MNTSDIESGVMTGRETPAEPERDRVSDPAQGETQGAEQTGSRRRRRNRRRRGRRSDAVPSQESETEGTTPEEDESDRDPDRAGESFENAAAAEKEKAAESAATRRKAAEYRVIGVRFRPDGKAYYFDPGETEYPEGAHLIVDTARGVEYGVVSMSNRMVSGREIVPPLRRVVRVATQEDETRRENNLQKETEAFNCCLSLIEARGLAMKLVDVEMAFDNSKLLFYFTAEERVDFRDLVKDLASTFHTRIEMRQIGIRDEAKLMGGLGVCGRPFCCKNFLPDFVQVSIKMAKEQNLSLNSAKISGACNRLMCCLRYEYDTYVAEAAITPKVDDLVDTPDGEGVVTESAPLKGVVKIALSRDANTVRVYRREDTVVKGHVKKQRRSAPDAEGQSAGNDRKPAEKKETGKKESGAKNNAPRGDGKKEAGKKQEGK